jgi:hypothetical protein
VIRVGLRRTETSDEGTFGVFIFPEGVVCNSLELPWRDNEPFFSCINVGTYICKLIESPNFGKCFDVEDVEGRTLIRIHAANKAGDVKKGYVSELKGCIAPGMDIGEMDGQQAVYSSRTALNMLIDKLGADPFELVVEEEF